MSKRSPRRRLFDSDGAEAFYAAFKSLPDAVKFQVLELAEKELFATSHDRTATGLREREALRALREAYKLHGDSPGIKTYESLRVQRPENAWPPARSVKRWLGVKSWPDALRRAQLPGVPSNQDPPGFDLGPKFSPEEICGALSACRESLGRVPGFNDYWYWAHRPDVRRQYHRLPLSQEVFTRVFGSFRCALVAAGLLRNTDDAAPDSVGRIASRPNYSAQHILESVCEVQLRLGHIPRAGEYVIEREKIFRETTDAGRSRWIPGITTIQRRYGCWTDVLLAAGLVPEPPKTDHPRIRSASRFMDPDYVIKALTDAYDEIGDPFTRRRFQNWRAREVARATHRGYELPTYHVVVLRWESWTAAIREMQRRRGERN